MNFAFTASKPDPGFSGLVKTQIGAVQKALSQLLAPTITAFCVGEERPFVPYVHPVVLIEADFSAYNIDVPDHWTEIFLPGKEEGYLITYTSKGVDFYSILLHGYVNGSLRDSRPIELLVPGSYTFRAWAGEYTEGVPTFQYLLFEVRFRVPSCAGDWLNT